MADELEHDEVPREHGDGTPGRMVMSFLSFYSTI